MGEPGAMDLELSPPPGDSVLIHAGAALEDDDYDCDSALDDAAAEHGKPEALTPTEAARTRAFLLRMAGALTAFGAPTTRVESLSILAGRGMGLRLDISAFPSWFLARTSPHLTNQAGVGDGVVEPVTMHHVAGGLDTSRLEKVEQLARDAANGKLTADTADRRLEEIVDEKPLYPLWLAQLSYGLCGFSCALLFYGGSFEDAGLATLGGWIVGAVCWVGGKYDLGNALEFICAFLIAILNRIFKSAYPDRLCFFAATLGALVWLFPGLSITNAVLEIASTSPISGTARMFHALVISLMMGFGLAIGSRVGNLNKRLVSYSCASDDGDQWWVTIIAFFGCFFTFGVLCNTSPRQMPAAFLTQATAYLVSTYSPEVVGDDAAIVVAAAGVGLVANFLGYMTRRPPYSNVVGGVLFLVPGSMGVRGAAAIVDDDYVSATKFGTGMVLTALSITIGLALAHALSSPLRGGKLWRSTYRWFMTPVVKLGTIAQSVASTTRPPSALATRMSAPWSGGKSKQRQVAAAGADVAEHKIK